MKKSAFTRVISDSSFGRASGIIYGMILSIAIVFSLSSIVSLILYLTAIPEVYLTAIAIVINILVFGGGGFIAARKAGKNGLVQGIILGAILLIIMLIAGMDSSELFPKAIYCLLASGLGGVFAVK